MLFKLRNNSESHVRTRDTHDVDRQRATRERIDIYIYYMYIIVS